MKECVKAYLEKKGYTVNGNALSIIKLCDDWYANRLIDDFHKRKNLNGVEYELSRMNFAKRCCADDANLCEVVSVAPEKESSSQEFINQLLERNRFDVQYRKQLEKTSADGTTGAYIYLQDATYIQNGAGETSVKGGKVCINYVDADCIIPLTVEKELVTECAFAATNIAKGKEKTTLVIFTKSKAGDTVLYSAETVVFNEHGKEISEESSTIQLGDVKPFAILSNAEVNNLDDMEGYGLPKIYNSIPMFKAVDLCYNLLYGDLGKGDKLVFLNELLACIQHDKDGKPYLTPQQKEIFILLGQDGGKLPDEKTLVQEYTPEIRIEQITKAFELVLSLLSMSFGYGTKKYTFENGRITTATEYIGTKQDSMQELNKQRKQASDYITDIVHAAMWFSNQFSGTSYDVAEPLLIEFDDSYITDKETELERKRNDAQSFDIPQLTVWYLMEAYNISEEQAWAMVQQKKEPDPDDDTTD
ncbi:MAG: hypothetical protein E7293_03345 [Lachnospiraceae bacterium]|nr:hypothetical protein [Lachnospiraceae bacterium]